MPSARHRRATASLVRRALIALSALAGWALPAAAGADDAAAAAAARERGAGRALERGLAWLASTWEQGGVDAAKDGDVLGRGNVVAASLAGLAFLQDGAEPDKGRFGLPLRKCLDFVVAHADGKTGLISSGTAAPMYTHAYATFFLAEAYARTNDPALKDRLTAAVRLIEKAQGHQGGWRYMPTVDDADSSVTSCQLVALLAARKAGVGVDGKVVERGLAYLLTCQNPDDGGIRYMPPATGSGTARTAAALAAFTAAAGQAGAPGPRDYDRAMKYVLARANEAAAANAAGAAARQEPHFYYGAYYLAQALRNAPDEARAKLYPPARDALVARQRADGSWADEISPEYATAVAVFVLGTPDSRLNFFRDVKPG